jgi:hypothetical protein
MIPLADVTETLVLEALVKSCQTTRARRHALLQRHPVQAGYALWHETERQYLRLSTC